MDFKEETERRLRIFIGCLILFLLVILLWGALESHATSITGSNMDGTTYKNNANYNTAWTASTATGIDNTTEMEIGQVDGYSIYRAFLYFDTSSLSGQTVTAAYLHIMISYDVSDTDFYIQVQSGMPSHPATPLANGEFNKSFYSGNYGQLSTASISEDTEYNITIDASLININGWTKICLRSSREIAGTTPGGDEEVDIYSASETTVAYRPHMVINSEPPGMITNEYPANGTNGGAITPWCHVQVNGSWQTRPYDPSPDGITESLSPSGTDVDGDWTDYSGNANLSANDSIVKVGSYSISLKRSQGFYQYPVVDYTFDSSIDISSFTNLRFWYKTDRIYAAIIMLYHADGTVIGWIQYGGAINTWTYLNLSMSNIDYNVGQKAKVLSACKKFRFYSGNPYNNHYLNLDELNFWKDESMTVRWYENSTGSWVLRQTNSTCSNGTYWWHFTQATSYLTTYYWKVEATQNTLWSEYFEGVDGTALATYDAAWNTAAAGSSLIEIDTAQKYEGSSSLLLYRDGTNTPYGWRLISIAEDYSRIDYWARVSSNSIQTNTITYGDNTGYAITYIRFENNGNIYITYGNGAGGSNTLNCGAYSINTWYHFQIDYNFTSDKYRVWINDVLYEGVNADAQGFDNFIADNKASCGSAIYFSISGGTASVWYDDLTIKTTCYPESIEIYHFTTKANSPPTVSNSSPGNGTTSISLQPWCHIDITDNEGDTMTVKWYENSGGSYVLRQTNSSVTDGTFWWRYVQATLYSTIYYWRVDVLDGYNNASTIYHFTTMANPSPVQSSEYPTDGITGVDLQTWTHITVTDPNGDTMTVKFYEYMTSVWVIRQTNSSTSNGTYWWHYVQASGYSTVYQWRVDVTDGVTNVSATYDFTTEDYVAPSQSNEYPVNETIGVSLEPWCHIDVTVGSDPVTIEWYLIDYPIVLMQSNYSSTSDTFWLHFTLASSYETLYWWRVDVLDGVNNISEMYKFTTIILHAPVESSPSPTNGSVNQAYQSWCHITVEDPIGDTMTIRWYESSTGPWILRQTNATASNGTYWWQYILATGEVQTYYWRVDASDGTFNTSRIYHFTTTIHTPPVISNPFPVNYSMDQGISPWCRITVSQIHGYALNVGFYEYIGVSWVLIQTNSSVGNGTYWWHYIDASSPFIEYRWKVVATSYGKSSTTCFVFETISNTERYFKNLEYNDYNSSGGIYSTVSTTMCKDLSGRQWVFWVGKDTSQHLCIFGSYTDNNWGKWYNITIMDNWNSTTWISVRDAVVTSNNSLVLLFLAIDGSSHSWDGLLTHYPSDPLTTWHIRMVYYGTVNYYWTRMAINNTDVIAITGFSTAVQNHLAYHRFTTNTWQDVWLANYGHFRYWSVADTTGDILIKSNVNGTFYLCWKYSTGVLVRDSKNLTLVQTINSVSYLEDFVILKNNRMALLEITSSKLYWCCQDGFGTFMKVEVGLTPVLLTARCSIDSNNHVTIYWRSGTSLKIVGPCMYSDPKATWTASLKTLYSFSDGKPFYPSDGYNSMYPPTSVWTTSRWTFSLYNDNAPYWNAMMFYNSTPLPPTPSVSPGSTSGIEDVPNWAFIEDLWILLVILSVGVMGFRMISSASRGRKVVK